MEKYLIELLESNNRVIVPDLGAFIIRQQEPRELVFNDLLAFNDGMLTAHIKQEEGISMSKAQVKIEEFVDQVKKVLTKGDIYHLENLGYLKMDDSSKIEFSVSRFPTVRAKIVTAANLGQQEEEAREEKAREEKPEPADDETPGEKAPVAEVPDKEALETESPDEEAPETEAPDEEAPDSESPEEEAPEAEPPGEEKLETSAPVPEGTGTEAPAEETLEWEDPWKSSEAAAEDGSFTLEDRPGEVEEEVDDDQPLIPDREEPPFMIEEQQQQEEKQMKVVGTSQARLEAAAAAAADEEKMESRQEPVSEPDTSIPYYYERERTIRNIWPWVGGAIALIVILIVAAWFFFPGEFNRILGGKSTEMETTEGIVSGESANASQETQTGAVTDQEEAGAETEEPGNISAEETGDTETDQTAEEPTAERVEESTPAPGPVPPSARTRKYYIVAGMFSSRANAENYVKTLKTEGYDAEMFGPKNNLYGVSFSSYESRDAALRELARIKEDSNPQAWLLYY
jgi:nucleoid DNA-binding protein